MDGRFCPQRILLKVASDNVRTELNREQKLAERQWHRLGFLDSTFRSKLLSVNLLEAHSLGRRRSKCKKLVEALGATWLSQSAPHGGYDLLPLTAEDTHDAQLPWLHHTCGDGDHQFERQDGHVWH